jgi:predicted transcriptional regulator
MHVSPHTVLVAVLDEYDTVDEPVGPQQIATAVETTPRQVQQTLDSLCRAEFLTRTAKGYRPTVTAREFIELDIELSDVAVVEFIDE